MPQRYDGAFSFRRHRVKAPLHDNLVPSRSDHLPASIADAVEAQELRQLVHQAFQHLSPDERLVLELRHQHKKSPGQVASRLGISRSRLSELEESGLAELRRRLRIWKDDR